MNREETAQILNILRKAYPVFYKNITKEEADDVVSLWHTMFEGDDVLLVIAAVKAFIATDDKGYPPVIGVIKKKMREISHPDTMSEMEAWHLVKKAASNSAYHAKEEFDKLPPTIQKIIGDYQTLKDWGCMDMDKFDTVLQSNFTRSFRISSEREKEYMALPPSVREFSRQIASGMEMKKMLE